MAATPVPAATVILLRDGAISPEVLLLERHAKSDFLPDLYVFPGGRVDDGDRDLADRVTPIASAGADGSFADLEPELAHAYTVAAIRETFEEAGLLLARRRGEDKLIDAAHAQRLARHRLDVQGGVTSFRALVEDEDLLIAADLLGVHAHWITPEMVPRRFDTFFFSAPAPPGQLAAHDGIESTDHVWIRPEDAMQQADRRERQMILPTLANLETLSGFSTAQQALSASQDRPVVPVLPRVELRDGERRLVIPEEAGYRRVEEFLGKTS